jgi:hypothetical protein
MKDDKYKYLDSNGNPLPGYKYSTTTDKKYIQDRIAGETDDERYVRLDKEYRDKNKNK